MCVSSMIMGHFYDRWSVPPINPYPNEPGVWPQPPPPPPAPKPVSDDEVNEFRRLLERAREYDQRNNEPACEDAEKIRALKELARLLKIDLSWLNEAPA